MVADVNILPYEQFYNRLKVVLDEFSKTIDSGDELSQIWIPGNSSNFAIHSSVDDERRRLDKISPVTSLKNIKNSVEIFGMKLAQVNVHVCVLYKSYYSTIHLLQMLVVFASLLPVSTFIYF